ncbi:MAG TPA: hypothetical protein VFA50_21900 [Stellaceae bacterium]|nr:hypothetical protein [Stellaceae bacterium]
MHDETAADGREQIAIAEELLCGCGHVTDRAGSIREKGGNAQPLEHDAEVLGPISGGTHLCENAVGVGEVAAKTNKTLYRTLIVESDRTAPPQHEGLLLDAIPT